MNEIQQTIQTVVSNLAGHWALSAGVAALAARWIFLEISQKLPNLITAEEQKVLKEITAKLTAPEDLALFKAVIAWVDAKIPNAGDQKYNIAAMFIVAQYKNLQPYQSQISALLAEIGQAAKQGIEAPPAP